MIKIGDKAPEINSIDQNGEKITLKQFLGKKIILLHHDTRNDFKLVFWIGLAA